MPTGRISASYSMGGMSFSSTITRTGSVIQHDPDSIGQIPAAKTGTLGTRTDDNTGIATMTAGHGIVTSDVVDVYWEGGVRRGMVATVSTNDVTLDGGAGDNLPAQDTAVTVAQQVTIDTDFDGDLLLMLAITATQRCIVEFFTALDASIAAIEIGAANEAYAWASDVGPANPLAGEVVAYAKASCGATSAADLYMGVTYDPVS